MQKPFRLLNFLIQPYMFRATNSQSSVALYDCIYSFWYNTPTLLPTGATWPTPRIPNLATLEEGCCSDTMTCIRSCS